MALNLIPQDPNFFLNNATARDALLRIRGQVDDPKHFLLLNRIDVALSNLQNIGEISDRLIATSYLHLRNLTAKENS